MAARHLQAGIAKFTLYIWKVKLTVQPAALGRHNELLERKSFLEEGATCLKPDSNSTADQDDNLEETSWQMRAGCLKPAEEQTWAGVGIP